MVKLDKEIQDKMALFAKEQSKHYLEDANLSYVEQLNKKAGQTKKKIEKQLSKFSLSSAHIKEAQDDMLIYMNDYMSDLVNQGYTQVQALEMAMEKLKVERIDGEDIFRDKYTAYYENLDPSISEAIGLYYAGCLFIFSATGAIVGFTLSLVLDNFVLWKIMVGSSIIGGFIGLGVAMLKQASIIRK